MGNIENNLIKILVFTPQIHLLAGAEKLALELAEGLNSQPGVQADLLVMGSEDEVGTSQVKQRLLSNGVKSIRFLGRMHNSRGRGILRFILKLRGILQNGDYDFIETSQMGPTIIACWATLGLRTQHIAGIHEIYLKGHQKNWSYRFLRFSVQMNRRIRFYAVSKQALNSWIDYARISPNRVRVIYNSIAVEHFETTGIESGIQEFPNIGKDEVKALFVGRLCKRKGFDTLIDAVGPVLDNEKVQLIIVGWASEPDTFYSGDKNLLERQLKKISDNGWNDRIHFLGIRNDIPKIMNFADVLVHPARDEGFGLVLAEALAAGLPIVATKVGGIPEVLVNSESFLVPPGDPIALQNAFLEILHRTPAEKELYRIKAQQRAEFFRPERRISDMLAMFKDLSNPNLR